MAEHYLIVSNPPHGEVDPSVAAPCLQMTTAEVRMKAHHPAPEIWLVEANSNTATEKAKTLLQAGLHVARVKGSVLAAVPAPEDAQGLARSSAGLTVTTASEEIEIAGDGPVVAVVSEPPSEQKRESRPSQPGGGIRLSRFVDLYFGTATKWRAVRLAPPDVDLSGLGEPQAPGSEGDLHTVVEALRSTFAKGRVDERLVGADYRFTLVGGKGVPKLLAEISADLKDIGPYDLASRLTFLTGK